MGNKIKATVVLELDTDQMELMLDIKKDSENSHYINMAKEEMESKLSKIGITVDSITEKRTKNKN